MSSLTVIPAGDPRERTIAALRAENESLREQLASAEYELQGERSRSGAVAAGVRDLRRVLQPLYQALGQVFGEMEAFGASSRDQPPTSAVWESWKQKLGGQTAKAIDVLILHGEMNAEQLRIHLRCARTHVYNVISRLNKAGIINKNGGKISLKNL